MLDRIKGIIPPMCTPFTQEGQLDVASVTSLAKYLVDGGIHGVFVLGSTGEFGALTSAEQQTVIETTVAAVAGAVPVYAGVLETGTSRYLESARMAKAAGADALVISPPIYFPISQPEFMDLCRDVYSAVDMPLIAYDIPGRTGTKLEPATLQALAEEKVLIGVKDSSGNMDMFRTTLNGVGGLDFKVFTGSELLVDVSIQIGAVGSVAGFANVLPAQYAQVYEYAAVGDWASAAEIQNRLLRCFWDVIGGGNPTMSFTARAVGGFKAALKALGVIQSSHMGAPLRSYSTEEDEQVAAVLRKHGFLQ